MSAGTDELTKTLFRVLGSAPVYRMNFKLAGTPILVEPLGFAEVMQAACFSDRITIKIDPVFLEDQNSEAIYEKGHNIFYFDDHSFGTYPDEMASMIHESVHAMQDLRKSGPQGYFAEEAAAYIAQFLYLRLVDDGKSAAAVGYAGYTDSSPVDVRLMLATADEIAGKIMGKIGAVVDIPDWAKLAYHVQRAPAYAGMNPKTLAANDG